MSVDPIEDDCLETIVGILTAGGHLNAARSEIVRVALLGLRDALAGRTRHDIAKFFVQRDADRLLAKFDDGRRRAATTGLRAIDDSVSAVGAAWEDLMRRPSDE